MPETINVCGVKFTIEMVDDKLNSGMCGECDHMKGNIKIHKGLSKEVQTNTLIHEWLHAALVMIGRNNECNDETFVQCLANAINQTFTLKDI